MSPRTIVRDIHHIGFVGWLTYAIDRALRAISGGGTRLTALWFYAQPVAAIPIVAVRANERIQTRVLAVDEIPEAAFGRPTGAVAERFAHGSVCIAAIKGADLAGFMWLQFDALHERLIRCDFVPQPHGVACWDFDFFVAPPYRLGRTFGRLWSHAREYLTARDVQTTLSWIAFDNASSQRAHERMGARRIGWAIVLTMAKLQLVVASTPPYFDVSVGAARRARLLVRAT